MIKDYIRGKGIRNRDKITGKHQSSTQRTTCHLHWCVGIF